MVLETLIATAAGYILNGIRESKGGKQAAEETSVAIWEWIRPIFLKDDPLLLEKIETTAPEKAQPLVELALEKKADDPEFIQTLQAKVQEADASSGGLRVKGDHNIVNKDIHHSTITINTSPKT